VLINLIIVHNRTAQFIKYRHENQAP